MGIGFPTTIMLEIVMLEESARDGRRGISGRGDVRFSAVIRHILYRAPFIKKYHSDILNKLPVICHRAYFCTIILTIEQTWC